MAQPTSVPIDSVRTALIDEWARLRSLASQLDDAAWYGPSILPGWSTGDVIAHIIGTESLLDGRAVPDVDISDAAHVRNPIGELNERWLTHFRKSSRQQVLDAYDEIIAVRTGTLNAMSQNDFDAQTATPAGPDSYGRFMRIRTFDCWVHDIDLRDSLRLPAPAQSAAAEWGITEIFASLPYVVGKRASAPSGTRVQVDVTGAATATARIYVGDRAGLVDDFGSAAPDVTLRVDAVDLARLAGGRSSADPTSVTADGDTALAQTIVAKLNYVV
ncbi:maleylpyruvate isomerase family mycothiol-dependent enzyme [Gordonia sp. TBRC 11910]|uniref:Maleylpyruvate isomerase family mycothiol-dependent enzyme n=1 Tax=Gordonia asplenii TaxID=2725283 RepID=A0A848KR79_9ACTN|nr:maleylpyruvate isomerase family mycothiol-dependent enzyme [Gordonia asplenii]NMO01206.1 maleylpyruvate isomerase family mycothiol-dependent enzyme [Gordonia asplenii]